MIVIINLVKILFELLILWAVNILFVFYIPLKSKTNTVDIKLTLL